MDRNPELFSLLAASTALAGTQAIRPVRLLRTSASRLVQTYGKSIVLVVSLPPPQFGCISGLLRLGLNLILQVLQIGRLCHKSCGEALAARVAYNCFRAKAATLTSVPEIALYRPKAFHIFDRGKLENVEEFRRKARVVVKKQQAFSHNTLV